MPHLMLQFCNYYSTHSFIILNRGSMFVKRIFPAVKLRPQTPPIDKREIKDAAIFCGNAEYILLPQPPTPNLGPSANERTVSSDVTLWRCTFWSGKFASLSSRSLARHAPSIYYYAHSHNTTRESVPSQ